VQIGLGTFGTIVQNLVGGPDDFDNTVGWLMESTSESRPERFRGAAVEPVAEHLERLRKLAPRLPQVRFVHAAIGDVDADGMEIHVLTQVAHDELMSSVPEEKRKALARDLLYLRNMSCVGAPHPCFDLSRRRAQKKYGIDISLEPLRTDVWSYGRLARRLDFRGCELLLVDAEGHDTKILRSMIEYCREEEAGDAAVWPDVIAFESAGHCDRVEGSGAERAIIDQLQRCGYANFMKNHTNTNLVNRKALSRSERLQRWVGRYICRRCRQSGPEHWPLTMNDWRVFCRACTWPPLDPGDTCA